MSTKLSEKYIYTLMGDAAFVLYMLSAFLVGAVFGALAYIALA